MERRDDISLVALEHSSHQSSGPGLLSPSGASPLPPCSNNTFPPDTGIYPNSYAEFLADTHYSFDAFPALAGQLKGEKSFLSYSRHLPFHFPIIQEPPTSFSGAVAKQNGISDFSHPQTSLVASNDFDGFPCNLSYSYKHLNDRFVSHTHGNKTPPLCWAEIDNDEVHSEDFIDSPHLKLTLSSSSPGGSEHARTILTHLAIPAVSSPSLSSPYGLDPSSAGYGSVPHRFGAFKEEDLDDLSSLRMSNGGYDTCALALQQDAPQDPRDLNYTCFICEHLVFDGDNALGCLRCGNKYHHHCITYGSQRVGRSWQCEKCMDRDDVTMCTDEPTEKRERRSSAPTPGININSSFMKSPNHATLYGTKQASNADTLAPETPRRKSRPKSASPLKHRIQNPESKRIHKLVTRVGRPTAWTKAEGDVCITIMKMVKQRGNYTRIDHLWDQVSQELKRKNIDRSAAAVKNAWNRELRARSGFDERATPNPKNMRTGLLQSQKDGRENVRASAAALADDNGAFASSSAPGEETANG